MSPDAAVADTTDDAFLDGRLSIRQPRDGYRAGLDAVLLAAAASVPIAGDCRVLDAGAGVGVVGLAIAARAPRARVTLVEIDAALAYLARSNAERNGFADRVEVVTADIGRGGSLLHGATRPPGLQPGVFTHLVSNPPYHADGSGTAPRASLRRVSHQMAAGGLERWLAFLATAARRDATLTLVHRADALDRILAALAGRFGGVRIRPVQARADRPAGRVLVSAVKGSRAPLTLLPALVLQDADGRYHDQIEAVMRHGTPLAW